MFFGIDKFKRATMDMDSRKRPPMSTPKSTARSHVSSVHGKTSEVAHIIRVTVQGVTGLTLNQNWRGDKETTNDENRKPTTDPNIFNSDVESGSESVLKSKQPKKSKTKAIAVIPKAPKAIIPKVLKATIPEGTTAVIPKVPNPDKLRAFITLSRSSTIVGTSNLSEPFHPLHKHDAVATKSSETSDEFEVPNMLDLERYAAIWPSTYNSDMESVKDRYAIAPSVLVDDASTIQCEEIAVPISNNDEDLPSNVISFETKLRRSITKKGSANGISATKNCGGSIYGFAPKSFEIIVGLAAMTNNNDGTWASSVKNETEPLIYVPLGIATLAINTQQQELELPVLSLSQGRPMIAVGEKCVPCVGQPREDSTSVSLDKRFGGSNRQSKVKIASIQPGGEGNTRRGKAQESKAREGKVRKGTKKQKRKGRWGIFGSKKRDSKKDEIIRPESEECNTDKHPDSRAHPTAQESATFNMKYSIGSSCEAVLRLKVEVFEKAVDREKTSKEVRHHRKESGKKKCATIDRKHLKAFYELNRTLTPDVALIDISDSEGDLTEYPSDASDNSDNISEYTGASWDTVSTMSTQGTHGTTFTTASWNSGSTGSTRGARTNAPNDEDENEKTASLGLDLIDSDDNEDALSNIEDEEESADDSHLTLHFGSKKFRVSTPNPIHVACQGRDNATWLAEKSTAVGKICNEKVWNWKHDAEQRDKCNSTESPHGVNEFSSIPRESVVDKIPKALTFSERQESLKQTVLDAISCQGSRACRQKYQTEPIEVAILTARSMVSLDCDDIRELRKEGASERHQRLEGAKKLSA